MSQQYDYDRPEMTFKESLLVFWIQMSFMAIVGIALAITAIVQALPWIILAGSVGVCLITFTVTACTIRLRRPAQPSTILIIQPGQPPCQIDRHEAQALLGSGQSFIIESKPKQITTKRR